MARILCHSIKQKAQLFKVVPTKKGVQDEFVVYLEKCVICEKPVLEIVRFDMWGKLICPVRLKTKNIKAFLDSMNVIWKPEKIAYIQGGISRFVLGYNEYGVHKKCSQNLYNIQLGKIETDPYKNIKPYNVRNDRIAVGT